MEEDGLAYENGETDEELEHGSKVSHLHQVRLPTEARRGAWKIPPLP